MAARTGGSRNDGAAERLAVLAARVVACRRCPRLLAHCRAIAKTKRRAFRDWTYWGRPVPSLGDPEARVLVVGLAPGAHGANRTGRMFTGDGSGETLITALYRAGFASQPRSVSRDDGLILHDLYLTASVRCAPPDNKPTTAEIRACRPYLVEEVQALERIAVVVCLGRLAHDAFLAAAPAAGIEAPPRKPAFRHGGESPLRRDGRPLVLLDTYHPSRQNTQTGRLTQPMLDAIFARARDLANG